MIEKIKRPLTGSELIAKVNEIIGAINDYGTTISLVSDISAEGMEITVTYNTGKTSVIELQDTTYNIATTEETGLMSREHVEMLNDLNRRIEELSKKV